MTVLFRRRDGYSQPIPCLNSDKPSLFIGGLWDGEQRHIHPDNFQVEVVEQPEPPMVVTGWYHEPVSPQPLKVDCYNAHTIVYDEIPWLNPVVSRVFVKAGLKFGFG